VMDEVFKPENFVGLVIFRTTGGQATSALAQPNDFLLWYAKDREKMRYNQLYLDKRETKDGDRFGWAENSLSGQIADVTDAADLDTEEWRFLVHDNITSQGITADSSNPFEWIDRRFDLPRNSHWKTNPEGMSRLASANRLMVVGATLRFKRLLDDFRVAPLHADWDDTAFSGFGRKKEYVVETNTKVMERCLLMTTAPGDLVLDPTCGSGTTAYVAEQWGRRWITCDSSRVALALAKHRLRTAKFDYFKLRPLTAEDVARNPHGTWIEGSAGVPPALSDQSGQDGHAPFTFACKTVPHITLKSIARNTSLDPIFAKHEPILAERLQELNRQVAKATKELKEKLVEKLVRKHREEGANAVTNADQRRWLLPGTDPGLIRAFPSKKPFKGLTPKQAKAYQEAIPHGSAGVPPASGKTSGQDARAPFWKEWEVPFDTDPDWPKPLADALTAYRAAWRAKMDEVNACISANAVMEELVDKPETVKGVVRVAGPFTMEGVIAVEDGLDTPIGGAPEELDTFDGEVEVRNAEAHLDKIIRLLKASGVDFAGNKNMKFSRLDPLTSASLIHAEGEWMNGDKKERRVAVSVGPEIGNVSSMQVEDVIRDANRKGYDDVVFAGFGFDASAQDAIESASHPKVRLHMALIRPDVAMGDLLKTQPGSQLFTVFTAPRVKGPEKQKDGEYVVEVEGMDVYDPVSNTLFPTDKERIAAWFLDTDYDGRTFCICQAFFPDKSKWSKLAKALGDADVIDTDAFEALSGLKSLPFPRPVRIGKGESWRVAVKVIDPRGNEGLRVLTINDG